MTIPSLTYPSERTCPPALRAELRGIEPTAELLYVGGGRWVLGTVRWYWPNVQKVMHALAKLERDTATQLNAFGLDADVNRDPAVRRSAAARQARTIYWLKLLIQGFRPVADYHGDPDGRIVRDFELRDFLYRVRPDALDAVKEAEALGDTHTAGRVRTLLDGLHTTGTDGWRKMMRHRVSVTKPEPGWSNTRGSFLPTSHIGAGTS